jgi:hypothetical protein
MNEVNLNELLVEIMKPLKTENDDLRLENEQLRIALGDLVLHVMEDVPEEYMTKHLVEALFDAQQMLSDLGDIDHEEPEE